MIQLTEKEARELINNIVFSNEIYIYPSMNNTMEAERMLYVKKLLVTGKNSVL